MNDAPITVSPSRDGAVALPQRNAEDLSMRAVPSGIEGSHAGHPMCGERSCRLSHVGREGPASATSSGRPVSLAYSLGRLTTNEYGPAALAPDPVST